MAERQYRALQPITKVLRGTLIALTAAEVVNLVLFSRQYLLVIAVQRGDLSLQTINSLSGNAAGLQIAAAIHTLLLLTIVVMFFRWIYRAMANVHAFGAGDDVYSPALSVGCFFIPFANFVMPCIAMSQIWRGSVSAGLWRDQPTSPLVGFWWAIWIAVSLMGFVVLFMSTAAGSVGSLRTLTGVSIVFSLGEIARNILIMMLAARIHALQEAQYNLADNFGDAPALTPS